MPTAGSMTACGGRPGGAFKIEILGNQVIGFLAVASISMVLHTMILGQTTEAFSDARGLILTATGVGFRFSSFIGQSDLGIVGKTRRRRRHICAIFQTCYAIFLSVETQVLLFCILL